MLNNQKIPRIGSRQRGAAVVEFGIIAMVFFTILFGIIEFGRIFYLYNTVQEVTRCAARAAVVTWDDTGSWTSTIPQQCLFGQNQLVAGWEIGTANVRLRALSLNYVEVTPVDSATNLSNCISSPAADNCIRFVEASLGCNGETLYCHNNKVIYQPMFGLIPLNIDIPYSTVVMPAESLGYSP